MAHVLKRLLGPAKCLCPGEWSAETASGYPAVACPDCGAIDELDEHRVAAGGEVSPVWKCQTCNGLTFLRLEAWGEEVLT